MEQDSVESWSAAVWGLRIAAASLLKVRKSRQSGSDDVRTYIIKQANWLNIDSSLNIYIIDGLEQQRLLGMSVTAFVIGSSSLLDSSSCTRMQLQVPTSLVACVCRNLFNFPVSLMIHCDGWIFFQGSN